MTVTTLYALTNKLAKADSTQFPDADKLDFFNIGYGIIYSLIIDQQEDNYEEEDTKTTVADQREYKQKARIHHINWLKINYGDGFIPARYKSEQDLISEYGNDLETVLSQWDKSDPIYWYKGKHFFIAPAPSSSQAGADRLKVSQELLPADLSAGSDVPDFIENFHYLLAVYAALTWLDEDDPLWAKRNKEWTDGTQALISTIFPRARQQSYQAHIPDDDGSDY